MERVIGVDQLRPRLGEYVERAEEGEVCGPRQLEFKMILDEIRRRGEEAGLTEVDVLKEVKEVRKCEL